MTKTPPKLSAAIIDTAPDEQKPPADGEVLANYEKLIADLQAELASTKAEYVALKQQSDLDTVRANLMTPYANKVFVFLCVYCGTVGVMLLLSGFYRETGFQLSDPIEGIIAGSTAVSAIGLVGWVVQGIFGITKASRQAN